VPYAEPSVDPAQAERQGRVGLRLYSPMTVEQSFAWQPADVRGAGRAARVAGVEAAHKGWSDPQVRTWTDHRDRLASHGQLWAQEGLTYFRYSMVNWV
jgi:hexosaminidase